MNYSIVYLLLIPEIYFIFIVLYYLTYTTIINLSANYSFSNNMKNYVFFLVLSIINIMMLIFNYISIGEFSILQYIQKDTFVSILQLITLFLTLLLIFVMYDYIKKNKFNQFEFFVILFFSILSICLLVTSSNMTNLYLLLELQGFSFYILTAYNKNNQYSVESGLKYYILGSFSSVLLLFGISILYGFTGLLSFKEIEFFLYNLDMYTDTNNINIISVSFLFIVVSFLFKLYAAPFHLWVSDIYQGAPMMVTAFFSTVPLISTFYLFSKIVLNVFYKLNDIYSPVITIAILSSFFLGTFAALYQKKIKRLLAFSTVTSIGYFLILFLSESPMLILNVFTYIALYSFSLFTLFAIFLQLYLFKSNIYIEQFTMLSGYYKKNKFIALLLVFSLFSIAGIPPFSLFIGKLFLLTNLAIMENYFYLFLVIIITLLSCYYYLKIIKIIFFNKLKNINTNEIFIFANVNFISIFIISLCVLLQLFFFLNPSLLTVFIKYSLFSLL